MNHVLIDEFISECVTIKTLNKLCDVNFEKSPSDSLQFRSYQALKVSYLIVSIGF